MPTIEQTPGLEYESQFGPTEQLAFAALQRQILERGERQLPDEPNQGFDIIHVDQESEKHPVSPQEALPLSYLEMGRKSSAVEEFVTEDLADRIAGGKTPLQLVSSIKRDVPLGGLGLTVEYPIRTSDYEAAVAAGKVEAGLFDTEGVATGMQPSAMGLETLVDIEQKQAVLRKAVSAQVSRAKSCYLDDLGDPSMGLKVRERKELQGLLEAYELRDGGSESDKSIRLLNFSATPLSEERLRQATNAVRAASDKGGGALFDKLRTIVILPEDHSSLFVPAKDEEGEFQSPRNGWQGSSMLALSERSIQDPEDRKPRSERVQRYLSSFFDGLRQPGESEGPDGPKNSVSMGDWEPVLAHELEHIGLPHNEAQLPGPAPTLYGRSNNIEHIAELGAAEYMGGKDALAVPEDQRQAKREMWQRQRSSDDGGLTYKQPLGPRFVTCVELATMAGPLPLRLRAPGQSIPAELTYRLVSEEIA